MKKLKLSIISALCLALFAVASCDKGGGGGGGGGRDRDDDDENKEEAAAEAFQNGGLEATTLLPVSSDDSSWGFINQQGAPIAAGAFPDRITLPYNGYFAIDQNDGYAVYKLLGDDGKYEPVPNLQGLKSVGMFSDGLIPATPKGGKIGVYDGSGNKKFEIGDIEGESVIGVSNRYSEGLLFFQTISGKCGYLDTNGNVAIKPLYTLATNFSEGYALVVTGTDPDFKISVIDTKGNKVFDMKPGEIPFFDTMNNAIHHGYIVASSDNSCSIYNMKGESKTFPATVARLEENNGQYVIYRDRNNKCGVADVNGNIIFSAQYDGLIFSEGFYMMTTPDNATGFLATNQGDNQTFLLNTKGEVMKIYPYQTFVPFGNFGYLVEKDSDIMLADKEGNKKGNLTFKNLNIWPFFDSGVSTDQKDYDSIAKTLAGYVVEFSVGGYALGSTPSDILGGEEPENYVGETSVMLPNLNKNQSTFNTTGRGYFSKNVAESSWNSYDYSYYYYWNYESKLVNVEINFNTYFPWDLEGNNALVEAFKNNGFTVAKQGFTSLETPAAILKKGNVVVYVEGGDSGGLISVIDTAISGTGTYNNSFYSNITSTTRAERVAEPATPILLGDVREPVDTTFVMGNDDYEYEYDYDLDY